MTSDTGIQSMTGFGTASVEAGGVSVRADLRSVNGKGFDLRLRLPAGLDDAEGDFRKMIGGAVGRGNVQLAVSVDQGEKLPAAAIDETAFAALSAQAKTLAHAADIAPPSADAILQLRGVVTTQADQGTQIEVAVLRAASLEAVTEALSNLSQSRSSEGEATAAVVTAQLNTLEQLVADAANDETAGPYAIFTRLKEQVARLQDVSDAPLDAQRLHAEAALLATKADIREELDRLTAHIASARALFAGGGAIGRKLEFLCQEFNREANTLCSKSPSVSLTNTGLAMKAVIDQMREQAANIA